MSDEEKVIQEKPEIPVTQSNDFDVKQYVDNTVYRNNVLQTYLNRITSDTQEKTDVERSKFVTFSRGIIGDILAQNPNAQLGVGDYSWESIFSTAWEGMFGKDSVEPTTEPDGTEEGKETPVETTPAESTAPMAPPSRRAPGDVQPVEEGEELEGYAEKLSLPDYHRFRMEHRRKTKTLKTDGKNIDWLSGETGIKPSV